MPRPDALDSYYARYYAEPQGDGNVTTDNSASLAHHIQRHVARHQAGAPITRIIDFGGGGGEIASALAEDVARLFGAAPAVTIVDYEIGMQEDGASFPVSRVRDLATVQGRAQVVLASAVLEHLTDPMPVLEQLVEVLEPGGLLYARTPSVSSLIAVAARAKVAVDFTYPGHLHDLGQRFWDRLPSWWPPCVRDDLRLLASRPSPVETTLSRHPVRTVAAYAMKAPWWILRSHYSLVGGWEAVFVRS